jgi:hypothetical protein
LASVYDELYYFLDSEFSGLLFDIVIAADTLDSNNVARFTGGLKKDNNK